MVAHLDGDEIILLPSKKYMIPRAIAYRDDEILQYYVNKKQEINGK
jgi:hypothetical protein